MLQDHRVHLPVAGHLLPDRGAGGLAAVPALPGRPLRALLPDGGPCHVHVRLRAVADAAPGPGRRHPGGPAARDLQLAHRGGPGRAGPCALDDGASLAPQAAPPLAGGRASWGAPPGHGRRRRQPAGRLPAHAHGRRRARGGRLCAHHHPARARRRGQLEPVRDGPVAPLLPADRLQEPARGPEAPLPRRRLEHHRAHRVHLQAQPPAGVWFLVYYSGCPRDILILSSCCAGGQPVAVPDGLCARGPLRRAGHRDQPLPGAAGAQRLAEGARHPAAGACLFCRICLSVLPADAPRRQVMETPSNHHPEVYALPRDHDVVQQQNLEPCEDLAFLLDKYRRDVSALTGVPHEMIIGRDNGNHETVRKTIASGRIFSTNMHDICRYPCCSPRLELFP